MSRIPKLKPCPFRACGGSSMAAFIDEGHSGKETVYMVVCSRCSARGPETLTKISAAEEWNERIESTPKK